MIRRYLVDDGIGTYGFLIVIGFCVLALGITYGVDYLYRKIKNKSK
jgi:preprotein translocase subunit SecE